MNFETKREHNRPWEHATGPVTIMGKQKSSRNSLKHGYYREAFRKFRKNRRKPETIMIEGMCLCLIKASYRGNLEDLGRIVGDLCGSTMNIWRSAENEPLESDSLCPSGKPV